MTLAFELFLKEHSMKGSEKADGYSKSLFAELDANEKGIVFGLLESELPWSLEWLFLLDRDKALSVAKNQEVKLRGNPYADAFILQQQIVEHSGDLAYQEHMIEDYFHYIDSKKPLVIDALNHTPMNESVLKFFEKIILVETNHSAVARASRHTLNAMAFSRATESDKKLYERLLSDLKSDDVAQKKRALAEVHKYHQQLESE